ncbi:MAG: 1-acyl-sn-glycerol-3-phosphate acyltransferase [Gammaproteobacteria bacterium]|jgi:1-acyl-sn-glycerol-3-phosphate acyltransferase|nr:1-acyl-sn-glycerol-3-phosphate acyltransferase [Gammaproteobacteria bacterium]
MQTIRSVVFTTYMILSACVVGGLMGICFWLPYRYRFAMARWWARRLFWVLERLCGLNFVVEGRERIPAGAHIVMSNHSSAWETIALFVIFPPHCWVLKRELLWVPFVGWGLKVLRPIAINRGEGHRAVNQVVEQGKARLADGVWVVVFPEGTRVAVGETKKFGVSGALLATSSGRLVVPLSHDAGKFWPRRGVVKKPGTIRVVIGEPITSTGKKPRVLNEEVRLAIDAGLAKIAAS